MCVEAALGCAALATHPAAQQQGRGGCNEIERHKRRLSQCAQPSTRYKCKVMPARLWEEFVLPHRWQSRWVRAFSELEAQSSTPEGGDGTAGRKRRPELLSWPGGRVALAFGRAATYTWRQRGQVGGILQLTPAGLGGQWSACLLVLLHKTKRAMLHLSCRQPAAASQRQNHELQCSGMLRASPSPTCGWAAGLANCGDPQTPEFMVPSGGRVAPALRTALARTVNLLYESKRLQ